MESLKISNVVEANRIGIRDTVKRSLNRLECAQKTYPDVIMDVISSGKLAQQIDLSEKEAAGNPRIDSCFPLSTAAGAYFFNEEIIGGSRSQDTVGYINTIGQNRVPGWKKQDSKLKLGPGIGLIEPPTLYQDLINLALENPKLTLNYTSPNGTNETKSGIKSIIDSRIDPEGSFYPENGIFVTEGATEGIDLFMDALSKIDPGKRVVFLGLSYYAGTFSAVQKGLKIDRLVASPFKANSETKFFPTAEEVERSLPADTKAIVLTIPNNPNGETYSDLELTKIISLAKKRGIYILFDAIFENMYFDEKENFRSKTLQIASELGALDRVVVVESLSKTKNFAGERIGYIASADSKMTSTLENIVLSRRCNPRLTLGPLLNFEGMARRAKVLSINSPNMSIEKIADLLMVGNKNSFSRNGFIKMYRQWDSWDKQSMRYVQDNLRIVKELLTGTVTAGSPDRAAFNTLVKVGEPGVEVNSMDYLSKLMYTLGTYTQVGACFGLSQKKWDEQLGIWPRITYASSREDLIEALTRLVVFTRFYGEKNFGDPNRFPTLQIRFDQQI